MSGPWRFRRCPSCKAVRPAHDFGYLGTFRPGWDENNPAMRVCPCGYSGRTSDFRVVRDSHPGAPLPRPMQLMLPTAPREIRP
jgi:hypothetical protein